MKETKIALVIAAAFMCVLVILACPGTSEIETIKTDLLNISVEGYQKNYSPNASFSTTGLKVSAIYSNGTSQKVSGYTLTWNDKPLEHGNTEITKNRSLNEIITVTYIEGDTIRETAFGIKVIDSARIVNSVGTLETRLTSITGQEGSASAPAVIGLKEVNVSANWASLTNALASAKKYVDLDLSECSVGNNGEFNPVSGSAEGKKYIISLVLPDAATRIPSGKEVKEGSEDWGPSGFVVKPGEFANLKLVIGNNITSIGQAAFRLPALTRVEFPRIRGNSLGAHAFHGCENLGSVSFPYITAINSAAFAKCGKQTGGFSAELVRVETISWFSFADCELIYLEVPGLKKVDGENNFAGTGNLDLIIVLGAEPPELYNYNVLADWSVLTKNVTVKTPKPQAYDNDWKSTFVKQFGAPSNVRVTLKVEQSS